MWSKVNATGQPPTHRPQKKPELKPQLNRPSPSRTAHKADGHAIRRTWLATTTPGRGVVVGSRPAAVLVVLVEVMFLIRPSRQGFTGVGEGKLEATTDAREVAPFGVETSTKMLTVKLFCASPGNMHASCLEEEF